MCAAKRGKSVAFPGNTASLFARLAVTRANQVPSGINWEMDVVLGGFDARCAGRRSASTAGPCTAAARRARLQALTIYSGRVLGSSAAERGVGTASYEKWMRRHRRERPV